MAARGVTIVLGSGLALALAGRALAIDNCRPRESKVPEPSMYVGAGACASQNCHGSSVARGDSMTSLQNEYIVWYRRDRHARAYTMLESELGKHIGGVLGRKPTEDDRCLSCHATYQRSDQPDTRCLVSDGVTCESCHGPAGGWLEAHTEARWTPRQSVERGMLDTTNPERAVETCLRCHLGDPNDERRRVTHELLAAGHPPLKFELDSFAVDMPAHWTRRGTTNESPGNGRWFDGTAWAVGQVAAAEWAGDLLAKQIRKDGWPDFASYDCQSCHHAYTRGTWKLRGRSGYPPLDVSRRLGVDALVRVKDGSDATLKEFAARDASGRVVELMRAIIDLSDEATTLGFRSAQQAVWALDALVDARAVVTRKAFPKTRAAIGQVYKQLADPSMYDPVRAAQTLKAVGSTGE